MRPRSMVALRDRPPTRLASGRAFQSPEVPSPWVRLSPGPAGRSLIGRPGWYYYLINYAHFIGSP